MPRIPPLHGLEALRADKVSATFVHPLEEKVVSRTSGTEVHPVQRRGIVRFVPSDVPDAVVEPEEAVPHVVVHVVGDESVARDPLPRHAHERRRIRQRIGQFAVMRDRGTPRRAVPRLERVARAGVGASGNVRGGGHRERVAIRFDGIAANRLGTAHAREGGRHDHVRYGKRRHAPEEPRLVHHAVPHELFPREHTLVVTIGIVGADHCAVRSRVPADAVSAFVLAGNRLKLLETAPRCGHGRPAEERRRVVRAVENRRHVANLVAINGQKVPAQRPPGKSSVGFVYIKCKIG